VGQVAARLLIQTIENADIIEEEVLLKTELIRRNSCV